MQFGRGLGACLVLRGAGARLGKLRGLADQRVELGVGRQIVDAT